jgi:hypothetical protein
LTSLWGFFLHSFPPLVPSSPLQPHPYIRIKVPVFN